MTFEQLKERLRAEKPASNPNACAYPDNNGNMDPWDEDEIEWLQGYSMHSGKSETKKEEKVITPEEKEEMDHFWQALILLAECRGAIETILQLDLRKDFLSPAAHKDLTDLQGSVEDLVDQYNVHEWRE